MWISNCLFSPFSCPAVTPKRNTVGSSKSVAVITCCKHPRILERWKFKVQTPSDMSPKPCKHSLPCRLLAPPAVSPQKTSKLRELWQSRAKETTWKNLSLSVCHESKLCAIYIYTRTRYVPIYLSIHLSVWWQARLQRRPIPGLDLWIGRKSVGHSCRCLSSRGTAMGKHAKVNGKGDERRKSSQITIVLYAGSLDQLNLDEFWSVCSKTQNLCL